MKLWLWTDVFSCKFTYLLGHILWRQKKSKARLMDKKGGSVYLFCRISSFFTCQKTCPFLATTVEHLARYLLCIKILDRKVYASGPMCRKKNTEIAENKVYWRVRSRLSYELWISYRCSTCRVLKLTHTIIINVKVCMCVCL